MTLLPLTGTVNDPLRKVPLFVSLRVQCRKQKTPQVF